MSSRLYQTIIDHINNLSNDKDLEKDEIIENLENLKKEIDLMIDDLKEDLDDSPEDNELDNLPEEDLSPIDLDKDIGEEYE